MEKVLTLRDLQGDIVGDIGAFTYSAKRMGGAPTISATYYDFSANAVEKNYYVEFNGEKYFVTKTPTSSKSNTDARYKYELELLSERHTLENIYFYDVTFTDNTPVAQQTTFKFGGTVRDLADKIQLSIDFSYGKDSNGESYYKIVVDEGIDDDNIWKTLEFQDKNILEAIQEFYNTFELPYYYVYNNTGDGTPTREFHVGYDNKSVISDEVFKYGADNSLLSITRSNANFKAINKITGVGSSDNIPYYYPNETSTGKHEFTADEELGAVNIDYTTLNQYINIAGGCELTYNVGYIKHEIETYFELVYVRYYGGYKSIQKYAYSFNNTVRMEKKGDVFTDRDPVYIYFNGEPNRVCKIRFDYAFSKVGSDTSDTTIKSYSIDSITSSSGSKCELISDNEAVFTTDKYGFAYIYFHFKLDVENSKTPTMPVNMSFSWMMLEDVYAEDFITDDRNGRSVPITKSGIYVTNAFHGAKIKISPTLNWVQPQGVLMPPIYRETFGNERFYIAQNNSDVTVSGYANDEYNEEPYPYEYSYNYGDYNESGELIERHEFSNPFFIGQQVEHILNVEDIKPTIKGATHKINDTEYPLDSFSEFAYDEEDNDELTENNEYKHPYFYAKLNPLGFNLFAHQSERGEMTVSMTSGKCIGCNFIIGVDKDSKKNLVQVDDNGSLLRDSDGNVRSGRAGMPKETPQDVQNDTTDHCVWIALKKEGESYGVLYPNVNNKVYPTKETDTFVITNINLPQIYITAAEKRLEDAIKKYLIENNDEKFKYSIKFSRIYLQEHESVRNQLTENSRLFVQYFGEQQTGLYVSSFTYKVSENEALPEISVELVDTLSIQTSVLKNVANQVKMEVMTSVAAVDVVAQGARAFLRKDQDDQTVHKITANEISVNGNGSFGGDANINGTVNVGGGLTVSHRARFEDTIESRGDITVGEYTEILGEIQGGKIGQSGDAVFRSVRANVLEIFTLIYNQIRSTSAYTAFDDSATISRIEEVDDYYKITFEEDKSSYNHHFKNGDILFGYVNKINDYGYSKNGRCWLRVTEEKIDSEPWAINVALFPSSECPDGENIPPTSNMTLMHRGNVIDTSRQSTFYISSKDGNIVQLLNVSSPKLYSIAVDDYHNYGVVLGKLPKDLYNYVKDNFSQLRESDPVLFAKYAVIENLIQIDYKGNPIQRESNRGEWSSEEATGIGYFNEPSYYDTVTYNGSLYKCKNSTKSTTPPSESADWLLLVSRGENASFKNILPNSNFDIYESDGETLKDWYNNNGTTINKDAINAEDSGYNSYSKSSAGFGACITVPSTFKNGETYTLSCKAISNGTPTSQKTIVMGMVLGIPFADIEVIDFTGNKVKEAYGNPNRTEWYFGECPDWTRMKLTFKYNSETDLTNVVFRLYVWSAGIEARFSEIQLERGSQPTMYSKSVSDLQGKDGKNGQDYAFNNAFLNANFAKYEGSNKKDITDWTILNTRYALRVNDYNGCNAVSMPGATSLAYLQQTVTLGKNSTYILALALNQQAPNNTYVYIQSDSSFELEVADGKGHIANTHATYGKGYILSTSIDIYEQCYIKLTTGSANGDYTFTFGTMGVSYSGSSAYLYSLLACPQLASGTEIVPFSVSLADVAGPAGEAGPVGYPQGEWSPQVMYKKTAGTAPFVYYPSGKGGDDRYYLLVANEATGEAQSPSNEEYWTPFTQFEYLFVKMLMANWAMFGGDNGGVFYDRYLFSQYGNGDKYYSNYKDKMWNTGYPNDAYLSGEFVPNMYIDFYRGAIKTSKFSEPFTTIEKDDKWNYYPVVPTGNHTLKISANITQEAIGEFTFRNRMIVMPSRADYPHYHEMSDGEHYTIFKEVGGNEYGLAWDVLKAYNNFDVVCSDKTLLTEPSSATGYKPSNLSGGSYGENDGWFLWHGMRSKMVLLAPSVMLKLRLQIRENETYWIIENSDDFIALNAQLLTLNESYATTSKINKIERFSKTQFESDSSSPQVNLSIQSYQPLLLAPRAMDYFRGNADDSVYFRFAYSYQNAIGGNGYMGDGVFKAMNPSDWYPN